MRWHCLKAPRDASTLPPAPRPGPAAKEFPFTLDPFQRTAINCLGSRYTEVLRRAGLRGLTLRHFAQVQHCTCQHCAAMFRCISVLVAAHTSAGGKTVIAQYACAMGLRYCDGCLCHACSVQSYLLQHSLLNSAMAYICLT